MKLFETFPKIKGWKSVKQGDLIAIRWVDAVSSCEPWTSTDQLDEWDAEVCVTVGFFWGKREKSVTLFASGVPGDSVGGVWVIPTAWIDAAVVILKAPLEEDTSE